MGARIAETMIEIFRDVSARPPAFRAVLLHRRGRTAGIRGDPAAAPDGPAAGASVRGSLPRITRLIGLPLGYIEPRHRLGLLDDGLMLRLVAARARIRAMLGRSRHPGVAFYDAERVCAAAPLRDNLLFGRVNQGIADAPTRVAAAIAAVIDELGMRDEIGIARARSSGRPRGPAAHGAAAGQRQPRSAAW